MLRVIAFNAFLFALPFLLYAAYVWIKRRAVTSGVYDDAPFAWLIASGLVLVIAGLFAFDALTGADPGGVYTPAQLQDGQIVPGRIVSPDESAGE